jgi:hypothetical protein
MKQRQARKKPLSHKEHKSAEIRGGLESTPAVSPEAVFVFFVANRFLLDYRYVFLM